MDSHREHTILLSRESENKGTKRMNSLPLSPVVAYHMPPYRENRSLQVLCYRAKLVPRPFRALQTIFFGLPISTDKSMLMCKPKLFFCRARKGLGTSLVLQCYTGLVRSDFLCKVAEDVTTGDNG